jgi:hypothetical protein
MDWFGSAHPNASMLLEKGLQDKGQVIVCICRNQSCRGASLVLIGRDTENGFECFRIACEFV